MPADVAHPFDVEYLPRALEDIKEEAAYLADKTGSTAASERFGRRITEAAESLKDFPYRRPVYRSLRNTAHEVRWLLADRWYLFYWIEEERRVVVIALVIYAQRNLEEIDVADLYPHLG